MPILALLMAVSIEVNVSVCAIGQIKSPCGQHGITKNRGFTMTKHSPRTRRWCAKKLEPGQECCRPHCHQNTAIDRNPHNNKAKALGLDTKVQDSRMETAFLILARLGDGGFRDVRSG